MYFRLYLRLLVYRLRLYGLRRLFIYRLLVNRLLRLFVRRLLVLRLIYRLLLIHGLLYLSVRLRLLICRLLRLGVWLLPIHRLHGLFIGRLHRLNRRLCGPCLIKLLHELLLRRIVKL